MATRLLPGSTLYDSLGTHPAVNAKGVYTDLSGSYLSPSVWQAMEEATRWTVELPDLLDTTGQRIAEIVGAEAARVTPGASSAIALMTAACITRGDGAALERLPNVQDLPSDVVIQAVQRPRYNYLRMVGMAGGQVVEVGDGDGTTRDALASALDPSRVAAVVVPAHLDSIPGALTVDEVTSLAAESAIPVIVDAAFLNYPPETMRRYTDAGAAMVCYSAKYFYGPNAAGFVTGTTDWIERLAAADFTRFEAGDWRIFGRPFKLDNFTIIGTLAALEEWFQVDHDHRLRSYADIVDVLHEAVAGAEGVRAERRFFTMLETLEAEPVNALVLTIEASQAGLTAAEAHASLYARNPRILTHLVDDSIIVAVDAMQPSAVTYVVEALEEVFGSTT